MKIAVRSNFVQQKVQPASFNLQCKKIIFLPYGLRLICRREKGSYKNEGTS